MFREGLKKRCVEINDYEAKVLHDPATNDAIFCNKPLSRKLTNKGTIAAKSSKTVRLGRVENSLSIPKLQKKTEKRPKRFDNSAPHGAVSPVPYVNVISTCRKFVTKSLTVERLLPFTWKEHDPSALSLTPLRGEPFTF